MSLTPPNMSAVESTDDTTPYGRAIVNVHGKPSEVTLFFPYGHCANPPQGSLGVNIASAGADGIKWLFSDDMINRFRDLQPGEVQTGNYGAQNYTKYDNDGVITLKTGTTTVLLFRDGNVEVNTDADVTITAAGNVNINCTNLNVTGNTNIDGNFAAANGTFTHNGTNVGSTHTHPITGGSSAPGPTGTPS